MLEVFLYYNIVLICYHKTHTLNEKYTTNNILLDYQNKQFLN